MDLQVSRIAGKDELAPERQETLQVTQPTRFFDRTRLHKIPPLRDRGDYRPECMPTSSAIRVRYSVKWYNPAKTRRPILKSPGFAAEGPAARFLFFP